MRNDSDHLQGTNFKHQPLCWLKSALLLLFSFVSFSDSTEVLLEIMSSSSVFSSTLSFISAAGLCSITSSLGLSGELPGSGAGAADSALGSTVLSASAVKDNKSKPHCFFNGFQENCCFSTLTPIIEWHNMWMNKNNTQRNILEKKPNINVSVSRKLNWSNWWCKVAEAFHNHLNYYDIMDLISGWLCSVFNTHIITVFPLI